MGNKEINFLQNNGNSNIPHKVFSISIEERLKNIFISLFDLISDIAMVIAPLLTYGLQIYRFNKNKSSKGFSKLICFLLFMGNLLRIFFWFGIPFKNTILYRSIGIVIFQIILIHLCIKYQDKIELDDNEKQNEQNEPNEQLNISQEKPILYHLIHWEKTFDFQKIWNWNVEIEYYKFMLFIIIINTILCIILRNNSFFFNLIGTISSILETLISFPQIIENYKVKNSKNVSFCMIFLWFLGDSFRLYYNIRVKAPLQMTIGIGIQVGLNVIVCIQLYIYREQKLIEINSDENDEIEKKDELDNVIELSLYNDNDKNNKENDEEKKSTKNEEKVIKDD